MIKNLKGHPHNFSREEKKRLDTLSKEAFVKESEIIGSEEILIDTELENEIKIRIGAENKANPA